LAYLTRLEHFSAPQEAFLTARSLSGDLDLTKFLPGSIRTIEVLESTTALNEWASQLLQKRHHFPYLQLVVLACKKLREVLIPDPRLHPTMSAWEALADHKLNYRDEDLENSAIGHEVWVELQKAGIEIVKEGVYWDQPFLERPSRNLEAYIPSH
jgi:hypothetical protein